MPKIIATLIALTFFSSYAYSCEIVSFVAPEEICLGKKKIYRGTGKKEDGCGTMTTENIRLISGPGTANIEFTNDDRNEATISFSEVGTYVLEYSFKDEASCGTEECTMQATTRVYLPSARFAEESISVCSGDFYEAEVIFTDASRATIQLAQGSSSVFNENDGSGIFTTGLPITESTVLKIIKAEQEADVCANEMLFDSLIVNVLDKPKLVPIDTICNETNELYSAVFRITGGDGIYTLISNGIGSIEGDILTTVEFPDKTSFDYTIDSGPTCGEFSDSASASCECNLRVGSMQVERVEACEDDIITVEHDRSQLNKRPTDSIIYALHFGTQDRIVDHLKLSYEPSFALPGDEALDTQMFISAIVGPFQLDNFNILDIECKDISAGTPVRWFGKDDIAISGKLEVCAGEKNRMYTVNISDELIDKREALFWYTSEGSGVVVESQRDDRAFVTFPTATSSGKLFYQVDRKLDDKTCSTLDSVEIAVDGTVTAPEASEIILWPGDIFASTSDGPCYQWGYIDRFANFSFNYIGDNNKYFFSDDKIGQQNLIDRAYFVAIYDSENCEFSLNNCNSITFFNQNVLNGLATGVQDDFELRVSPNPSDGRIKLEIKGSYQGLYSLELFSELGQRVSNRIVYKEFPRSISDLDYSDFEKGMYFLRITNELGDQQVIKTIIAK